MEIEQVRSPSLLVLTWRAAFKPGRIGDLSRHDDPNPVKIGDL